MSVYIKVIAVDEKIKEILDDFSKINWDENRDSPEETKNNFFAPVDFAVVAYANDKIAGLLYVHNKNITFKGKRVKLGGIGGVVVDKNLRRLGIATRILKVAMAELKRRKFDVSMLCTDIKKLGKLYQNVGFVPLNREYYFYDRTGKLQKDFDGMIASVGSRSIFNLIVLSKDDINVGKSNF